VGDQGRKECCRPGTIPKWEKKGGIELRLGSGQDGPDESNRAD